jgi:hypothetical protein
MRVGSISKTELCDGMKASISDIPTSIYLVCDIPQPQHLYDYHHPQWLSWGVSSQSRTDYCIRFRGLPKHYSEAWLDLA